MFLKHTSKLVHHGWLRHYLPKKCLLYHRGQAFILVPGMHTTHLTL